MKKMMSLMVFVLLLFSCATTYQPKGFTGGFSETQLGENIFQVSFRGNGYTSSERTSDFNLLRSAEVAIEHGFKYFAIVESGRDSTLSAYTTPTQSHTTGSVYGSGNHAYGTATTTTYGGQTYFISKPRATNTILCFKEKPEINGLVFESAFVARSIKQKYGITN